MQPLKLMIGVYVFTTMQANNSIAELTQEKNKMQQIIDDAHSKQIELENAISSKQALIDEMKSHLDKQRYISCDDINAQNCIIIIFVNQSDEMAVHMEVRQKLESDVKVLEQKVW